MDKGKTKRELVSEILRRTERQLNMSRDREDEEVLEVNAGPDEMLVGEGAEEVKAKDSVKKRRKSKKGRRETKEEDTDIEEGKEVVAEEKAEKVEEKCEEEVEQMDMDWYSLSDGKEGLENDEMSLMERSELESVKEKTRNKRRREENEPKEEGNGDVERRVWRVDDDKRSAKEKIKKIKKLLEVIEDKGVEKTIVRKIRNELDELWEAVLVNWNRTETVKVEVENKRDEMEAEASGSGEKTSVERRQKLAEADRERNIQRWAKKWAGEVGEGDAQIQLIAGKSGWAAKEIREGMRSVFKRMGEEVEKEIEEVVVVKRSKDWDLSGESNFIVRLPLKLYALLEDKCEKYLEIDGRRVRYVAYVTLLTCWKCMGYGHMQGTCRGINRCGRCGGGHPGVVCRTEKIGCAKCEEAGEKSEGHRAGTMGCPIHRAVLETRKRMLMARWRNGR